MDSLNQKGLYNLPCDFHCTVEIYPTFHVICFCSDRLEYARKGHSLFKVLVAEEEARAKTEILKLKRESDNSRKMWLPPGESRYVRIVHHTSLV